MSFGFGGGYGAPYGATYNTGYAPNMGMGVGGFTPLHVMNPNIASISQSINDMQLRQYIDQVFMRYDFNRTGTLNLQELHMFLNELFGMCGIPHNVSYGECYNALMAMDANRDGQVNKYELFNLFRYMTTPNFQPIGYSFGNRSFGLGSVGMGGVGYGGAGYGNVGYGGGFTTTTTTYPATTTYATYGTGLGGMGGGWSSAWGGW